MRARKIRLLLLSVGGGVANNFLDALGERRKRCVILGTNSIAEAASSFRCDAVYRVPNAVAGSVYIDRIAALIQENKPDLVIPCRDDDILALSRLSESDRPCASVLLTGSVAAAHIMNDKAQTARFAARHGLSFAPTAETARDALEMAEAHGLPLIGKPRSGNASQGVVLLRTATDIERAFDLSADLIAQPYLDPPADKSLLNPAFEGGLPLTFSVPGRKKYSVQVFVGPDGAVSNSFGTVSAETGTYATEYRRRDDRDLLELGHAYACAAAAEGWKGPLNVQLKRTNAGQLVAFELNGRFTGGTGPRAVLGFDEIREVMMRFLPGVEFPALAGPQCEVAQSYFRSYPVIAEGITALESSGQWLRS